MMNFDDFLEELENSEYKKEFVIDDIHSDKYSNVLFKITFSFVDKGDYLDEDNDDPIYTEERYEEGYKNWIGDDYNDGLLIGKFLKHYGVGEDYNVDYEFNRIGEVVWADIFWNYLYRSKEDYNRIVQVLKNFSKDYSVNDYKVIDSSKEDYSSLEVSFYENKNDDFDTSIFKDMVHIETWLI